MQLNKHDSLARLPVFRKLTPRELADIAGLMALKTYQQEEQVAFQGDIWPYVLLLVSGEVRVQKLSSEGRSLGAWWLSPSQCFWSPSLFDDGPLPASLEARQPSEVGLWHRDWILPIVQSNRLAMWDLCSLLTQRIRQASEMVEDLAFSPVTSRLARLLVKHFDPVVGTPIQRSLTLDEMATMIGTTPVMVCKLLSRFADQGMIRVSRTEFEFVDTAKLEQLAG
jgi:CRP/FNR family transcriptional regulator